MPIHAWIYLHKHNDVRYMDRRCLDVEPDEITIDGTTKQQEAFFRVWNLVIDEFGLSEEYKSYLNAMKVYAMHHVKHLKTGDRMHLTMANVAKARMDQEYKDEGINMGETFAALEKHFGFQIDAKKCTLYKYYSYVNTMAKDLKNG